MKTYINGIVYDTGAARPIATGCFSLHGITVEETVYQMPAGQHQLLWWAETTAVHCQSPGKKATTLYF